MTTSEVLMSKLFRVGFAVVIFALAGCGEALVGSSTLANTPPTIAPIGDVTAVEDVPPAPIALVLTDTEDTDVLVVTASSSDASIVPAGGLVVTGTGAMRTLTITPLPNANGTVTITVSVADGDAYVVTTSFELVIAPVNDAPTITGLTDQTILEDGVSGPLTFTVADIDDAASTLTVTATSSDQTLLPAANVVLGGADGARTITLTPVANGFGTSTITVTVMDTALSAAQTFVLTVTTVNDAPVANADSVTLAEGGTVPIDLAVNDTDLDGTIDVGSIVVVVSPQHGSVAVNLDGTVAYTHDGGETTTDSFTYTIADAEGLVSPAATVTITITPVNDAPVANTDVATVLEAGSIVVDLAANDTDSDDAINLASIAIVAAPTRGTTTINGNGTVSYQHDGSETIVDSFTYTIRDASNAVSNVATVNITISPVNDAPIAVADPVTVSEGGTTVFTVLANDTDADDGLDPTSIVIVTPPMHGTYTVNPAGTVTYDHDGLENSGDTFTYTVADMSGAVSNVATVTVVITPVNDDPIANPDSLTVSEGGSGNVVLAANDTDPENALVPTSIVIVAAPTRGTLGAILPDGSVTYTHNGSETTTDSFTYTIRDALNGLSNVTTVTITVIPVNDAPVAVADVGTVAEGGSATFDLGINDTDADGTVDLATIVIASGPAHGVVSVNANGTVLYAHDGSEPSSDTFTYTIKDNLGLASLPGTVTITITPVNDAPIANNDAFTVLEGGSGTLTVAANDVDPELALDLTSLVIVSSTTRGTLTTNANGTFSYQHDGSETTSDSFTYTIEDQQGLISFAATVSITITPVNDAPVVAAIADASTGEDLPSAPITITFTDVDNPCGASNFTLAVTSANTTLLPAATAYAFTATATTCSRTLTITPGPNAIGSTTVSVVVTDAGGAASAPVVFTFTVTAVIDDAPVAVVDGPFTTTGNVTVVSVGNVLTNDTDADIPGTADVLRVTGTASCATAAPVEAATTAGGRITITSAGGVTYTPPPGYLGNDSFTYRVCDTTAGTNLSSTGVVSFTVGTPMRWFVDNDHPSPGTVASGTGGTDVHPFATFAQLTLAATAAGDIVLVDYGNGTTSGYDTGYAMTAGMSVIGMPLAGPAPKITGAGATPAIRFAASGTLQHIEIVGGTNGVDADPIAGAISLIDVDFTNVASALVARGTSGVSAVTLDGVRVTGASTLGVSLDSLILTTAATNRTNRIAATGGTALLLDTVAIGGSAGFDLVTLVGTTGTGLSMASTTGGLSIGTLDVELSGAGTGVVMTGGSSANLGTGGIISVGNGRGIAVTGGTIAGTIDTFECLSSTDRCLSLDATTSGLDFGDFSAETTGGDVAVFAATVGGTLTIADLAAGFVAATGAASVSMTNVAGVSIGLHTIDGTNAGSAIELIGVSGSFTVQGGAAGPAGSGGVITSTAGSAIYLDDAGTVSLSWMNVTSTGDIGVAVTGPSALTLNDLDVDAPGNPGDIGVSVSASTGSVSMNRCNVHDGRRLIAVDETDPGSSTFSWNEGRLATASISCVTLDTANGHALAASFTGTDTGGGAGGGADELTGCGTSGIELTDASAGVVSLTLNRMDVRNAPRLIDAVLAGGGNETLSIERSSFAGATSDAVRWLSTACNGRNQVDIATSTFGPTQALGSTSTAGSAIDLSVAGNGAACRVVHTVTTNEIYGVQTVNESGVGLTYALTSPAMGNTSVLNNDILLYLISDPSPAAAIRLAVTGGIGPCVRVTGNALASSGGATIANTTPTTIWEQWVTDLATTVTMATPLNDVQTPVFFGAATGFQAGTCPVL